MGTPDAHAAPAIDPNLKLGLQATNLNVILNWWASNAVAYQVESSFTLTQWNNSGSVVTGRGSLLFVTNQMGRVPQNFYRVKRLPPATQIITASFDPATGILTVTGDDADNVIVVSRTAAGAIVVNGGAIAISGGTPTVANTTLIRIFGRGGNDQETLNEANGALPKAEMYGEDGNDTLTGGSGADLLDGGPGDDTLLGKGGDDVLFGRSGNDTLTGGDGNDTVNGDEDNDRLIWNPGDDTDVNEGGAGIDTVEINGGNGAEVFTTTANGTRVRFDRVDPAPFSIDIGTCENLVVNMNGGNDSFSATGNLAALIQITVDGGAGDDTILGSNGADVLLGGDNNDFIDGQQGNDAIFLGAGDDVVQWDPGDGSDTIEGQGGTDKLLFNCSAANEIVEISPNGGRVRLTRNIGNIVLDLDDIETADVNLLGGIDSLTINHLAGTDLATINANLAASIGGAAGDAAADTVIVNGSSGPDVIDVVGAGTSVSVLGLTPTVNLTNSEGANDSLAINALGGDDRVTATTLPAGVVKLTIDGGADKDTLFGSQGDDVLSGGDGDDFVFGDNGNDVAFLGAGNDTFQWEPGDGNDTVEGQAGSDTLLFLGANVSENIDINPNGGRVLFLRNVANVTMDLDDVENIEYRALGGADNIVVGDMVGTDLTRVTLDLRGPGGGGDGAADTITVNGSNGNDVFGAAGDAAGLNVFGLQAAVRILSAEPANDRLTLNALAGDDVVDASALEAGAIQLAINGGLGADVMIGSKGDDLFTGGDGNDTALMGAGNDTFVWNPGDDNDTIEGQGGTDTLLFNGANIAENIDISANGSRVRFFRNVASVVLDLNDTEVISFNALGGADVIAVNDLSGTDVATVNLNLSGTLGGTVGDGASDTVIAQGTAGDDVILINGDTNTTSVLHLPAQINITGGEPANDRVTINALAGNDVVDATSLQTGAMLLTADGGPGDDILLGGAGNDTLLGGDNDDILLGGPGIDVLDGGLGENVLIQDGVSANASSNVLTVFGDAQDNTLVVSRNAAGNILTNGAIVPGFTVANTTFIRVYGFGGNDTITFNEANGALPPGLLAGGAGNNTLTGGSGGDVLFGGAANDILLGKGGLDLLFGCAGNDTLTGGDADDQVFGGAGDDRMIWNPGDDTDLNEGGGGTDTVEINGGNGDEQFTTTANGTRVRFDRLSPAPFSLDIGTSENLVLNMNGGNDSFSATGNLAALIHLTVDGGAGDDTILGSNGADLLLGGDDNDFIDGQQGNDTILMGAGNDTFQWDPGDGSDIVEGQAGADTVVFNGAAIGEIFQAAANGSRVLFTRNIANIVLDLNDVESLNLNALGGPDALTVNPLAGTSLTAINVDLAGTLGGAAGDATADSITLNGTAAVDVFNVTANAGVVSATAAGTTVRIAHPELANDALILNGLGGLDLFSIGAGVNTLIGVTTNQ